MSEFVCDNCVHFLPKRSDNRYAKIFDIRECNHYKRSKRKDHGTSLLGTFIPNDRPDWCPLDERQIGNMGTTSIFLETIMDAISILKIIVEKIETGRYLVTDELGIFSVIYIELRNMLENIVKRTKEKTFEEE